MRTQLLSALAVFASLPIVSTGIASANEYSYPGGLSTHAEAVAAVGAAEQYLRSRGYDAATVGQMDIVGHGV